MNISQLTFFQKIDLAKELSAIQYNSASKIAVFAEGNSLYYLDKDSGINTDVLGLPIRENSGSEFSEQILTDLIAQGFSGQDLLVKFKEMNKKVAPAMKKMIGEADSIGKGEKKAQPWRKSLEWRTSRCTKSVSQEPQKNT